MATKMAAKQAESSGGGKILARAGFVSEFGEMAMRKPGSSLEALPRLTFRPSYECLLKFNYTLN